MKQIDKYLNRFYTLLESKIGDVKPLITEDRKTNIIKEQGVDLVEVIKQMGFIAVSPNNYKHKTQKDLMVVIEGGDVIVKKGNKELGRVKKSNIIDLEGIIRSSFPSQTNSITEQVISPKGDPYEYKKEGNNYYARKKGSQSWVKTSGKMSDAIASKIYKTSPTASEKQKTTQVKTTTQNYKYSPRIDKELDYIKARELSPLASVKNKSKSFFIYDPKFNLIYLFGPNYEYIAHTSVVDGADAQKNAEPFTVADWCKASKLKTTPHLCSDDTGKPKQPAYYVLEPIKNRFLSKGIYSISYLTRNSHYTGKGKNVYGLKDDEGEVMASAIHGIPNIEKRLTASADLESKLKSDISKGKVPQEYLNAAKTIANANQSYGCVGVPASFIENPKVIKAVEVGTQLFVIGEGDTNYLVQNSDDFFNKLGSDGESCTSPEALAQNMGTSIPSSETSDISRTA